MIYICIPALNEARTIGVLLWKIRQVMDEFPRDYHVLVLDDGSTDDTREVLEPYLGVLPVTVLRNDRTQGYPAALERLLREAVHRSTHPKRDGVVTLQADFTESPDDIPLLLKRLEGGADIVGVTVTQTEGELPRALRWSRRGLPWLLSRAPLPKEVGDPLSGFRAYRVSILRRALQDLPQGKPMLTKHGWAANAELLLSVLPHVRRAEGAEVSLRYSRRDRPTRFRPWSTALELWDLARKAPRRLAQARAAAAAADGRAAAGQPLPPPQRPPAPAPSLERQQPAASPRAHRQGQPSGQPAQRHPHQGGQQRQPQQGGSPRQGQQRHPQQGSPEAQRQAPQDGQQPSQPRAQQGGQPAGERHGDQGSRARRQAQREPQPRPEASQPTQPTAEREIASAESPTIEATDTAAVVSPEAPAPSKPKRRRPPRRRSSAAKAAAAAAANGDAASAEAPVAESSAPDASVSAAAEPGDAPAPKKRSSRPRRPRRPRGSGSPPADSGAGGGEGGGTTE